jgi:hypothetical protein
LQYIGFYSQASLSISQLLVTRQRLGTSSGEWLAEAAAITDACVEFELVNMIYFAGTLYRSPLNSTF